MNNKALYLIAIILTLLTYTQVELIPLEAMKNLTGFILGILFGLSVILFVKELTKKDQID